MENIAHLIREKDVKTNRMTYFYGTSQNGKRPYFYGTKGAQRKDHQRRNRRGTSEVRRDSLKTSRIHFLLEMRRSDWSEGVMK